MPIALVADIHIDTSEGTIFETTRVLELARAIKDTGASKVWLLGDILNKSKPTHYDIITLGRFLDELNVLDVAYIDGNHERVRDGKYILDDIMQMFKISKLPNEFKLGNFKIIAIGHSELYKLEHIESADLLLSHFRWSHPLYGKGEVKHEQLLRSKCENIILGDIHNFYKPHPNVTYISQPYASKYQTTQENGFILLDIKDAELAFKRVVTNLPTKIKLVVPLSKLIQILETLDLANKYVIDVIVKEQKELKTLKNIRLPKCVTRLRPKLDTVESVKEKAEVVTSSILDTILSILPKTIKQEKEYIKDILEKQ
jgi:predicted phosphodiesterase